MQLSGRSLLCSKRVLIIAKRRQLLLLKLRKTVTKELSIPLVSRIEVEYFQESVESLNSVYPVNKP